MNHATPFAIVLQTAYGPMLVSRHDINQTRSLLATGRAPDHASLEQLAALLRAMPPAPVVLDIGANFGTYTLALAPLAGRVFAFEAQRIIANMLAGSVALNGHTHVWCLNLAVGAAAGRIEVPQFDYNARMNFGSVEFGPQQTEVLSQARGQDPARREHVALVTVDSLELARADLVKIDVEGMEQDVLDGAAATIRRCRPVMFVEWLKNDPDRLRARIAALGYDVHVRGINLLAVPSERRDSVAVTPPELWSIH